MKTRQQRYGSETRLDLHTSSFITGFDFTFMHRDANINVDIVSASFAAVGPIVATKNCVHITTRLEMARHRGVRASAPQHAMFACRTVFAFPDSDSCNNRVSLESRKGM